jgi:hypothetical protein
MPAFTSIPFDFATATTGGAGAPVIPVKTGSTIAALPFANTREMVILNRGTNPVLFGVEFYSSTSVWPSTFGGPGGALTLTEGLNCTRIPAGASLTLNLGAYQERGNFNLAAYNTAAPVVPLASEFPLSLITFASTAAGATTVDITYITKLGQF